MSFRNVEKEGGKKQQLKKQWMAMVRGKALDNCVLVLLSLWLCIHSLPIDVNKSKENTTPKEDELNAPQSVDTGLHYDRYLREVIEYLEKDPHFREKLQNASMEPDKLAKELDFVHNNLRTKLDELKREEMNRLRMLIKAKHDMELGAGWKVDYQALLKQFEHLNHDNAHSFEVEDLDRLIKAATKDLVQFDKQHHEEFKRYEMMKEHKRREKLKAMSEEARKKEEQHHEEMKKKYANHAKVNHPGSEDQLKEVWEESDGLEPDNFDPKTFFKLHDNNGDGFFDENELEALFVKELEKVYKVYNNEEDDMMAMEEERRRMREHVMAEVDTNKDRLVSLAEFLAATKNPQFRQNDEWETLEQQNSPYTEEELVMFEQQLAKDSKMIVEQVAELQKQRENLQNKQDLLDIQKRSIQQATSELEKRKVQSKSDVK
ncbi:nucleobindin-2-like isoform X1 [Hippocampus zosterae]|uniref:nucleobindin-2-like isoform X1 n=2 Tax=Hippocampus zosterae TaxID=109293 RepID=UPI00223CA7B5|nr:nucleobindin-2-like isoform X1 [Hippocampus zosterae]